jgi:Protein of unknown function (DUF3667)
VQFFQSYYFCEDYQALHVMKHKKRRNAHENNNEACKNCGHVFTGKICNMCGEAVFHEHQLSASHFLHEVIDFFYHFESKVLKTIKLNFLKPGFITNENLRGVRIPYARPVQLYLVVAVLFYISMGYFNRKDYIPAVGDHHYFGLSSYIIFKWAEPLDNYVQASIDSSWVKKGKEIEKQLADEYTANGSKDSIVKIYSRLKKDSIIVPYSKVNTLAFHDMLILRGDGFYSKIASYSKAFVFLLIPFFAVFFLLFFYKKLATYGAALIFSTHFFVYNLSIYMLYTAVNVLPAQWLHNKNLIFWMRWPFDAIFYNSYTEGITTFIFGEAFEFTHFIFWMPWLFIAFKRLFATTWWKNILISYLCCRIFYYLIFGMFKKALIAFTIWSIHA